MDVQVNQECPPVVENIKRSEGLPCNRWVPCVGDAVRNNVAWVHCSASSDVPEDAVIGGYDSNGANIYIGRSYHSNNILVGRVMPAEKCCYVCILGVEHKTTDYDILTGVNLKWLPGSGGRYPPNSVIGGVTSTGSPVYIVRAHIQGSLVVGKHDGSAYIPFGGKEHRVDSYEVLTHITPPEACPRLKPSLGMPQDAVIGGYESAESILYVGRAMHKGDIVVGKVVLFYKCAFIGYIKEEQRKEDYEMLAGTNFKWLPGANGSVPPNAVVGGVTHYGESTYIGRGFLDNKLIVGQILPSEKCLLVPLATKEHRLATYEVLTQFTPVEYPPLIGSRSTCWESGQGCCVPESAVVVDVDACIYVGRAFHKGDLLPAMVIPHEACAYVCYAGGQEKKTKFEVLLDNEYCWKPAENGYIPPNSVEGCYTAQEEPLYIGRIRFLGNVVMGKVQQSHGCMYIAFNGQQVAVKSYEVLVFKHMNI